MTAAHVLATILLLAGMGLMAVLAVVPLLLERDAERDTERDRERAPAPATSLARPSGVGLTAGQV